MFKDCLVNVKNIATVDNIKTIWNIETGSNIKSIKLVIRTSDFCELRLSLPNIILYLRMIYYKN